MEKENIKKYVIFLCILDYLFTVIGIEKGYLTEANPIFECFFEHCNYSFGLLYKIIMTMACLEFLCKFELTRYMNLCLCIYLSVNAVHIFYIIFYFIFC